MKSVFRRGQVCKIELWLLGSDPCEKCSIFNDLTAAISVEIAQLDLLLAIAQNSNESLKLCSAHFRYSFHG